ncbi:DUF3086 domain-containing protein [Pleurocapsa sp. CCALA 161]|uniref:DUF3086 domain-containing protein n=1 Tax=Pleurocapsa sp. CCALA 161 TaxID=2107688 RepID=UPI000D04DD46|nr:DUF3086 domain-containing protein [Pleurocapsa sp. CCALA 161]PSB09089.1 DUF3086 domain-containing protein [Pleurocapsa sp. CCALA 161]
MNSDIPSIPESENSETIIFEPAKSSNTSADEQPEVTSDAVEEQITEVSLEPAADSINLQELDLADTTTSESVEATSEDNALSNDDQLSQSSDEPVKETELFVDSWLDESEAVQDNLDIAELSDIRQLEQQKAELQREIAELKAHKEQLLLHQIREAQENLGRMIEEGTRELKERKTALRIEIEKLERRQQRLNQEMRSNFAGSSKELAIRVQGFKEYLVGSLQDLATAAEKLELGRTDAAPTRKIRNSEQPRREDENRNRNRNRDRIRSNAEPTAQAQFSEPTFADQSRRIRQLLDKYCNSPDYYGSPWQLRRTFDQNQAKKVQEWFFSQGGRGAIDSTGSRLQNILVASAIISILHDLYRDRTQVLILTDTPENLGEWRKGLEDCLGISRRDFGANRGVVMFDSPEILVQRAERLLADKLLPIIIIDETEAQLNLSVLKFPIWLAFASSNKPRSANYLY